MLKLFVKIIILSPDIHFVDNVILLYTVQLISIESCCLATGFSNDVCNLQALH